MAVEGVVGVCKFRITSRRPAGLAEGDRVTVGTLTLDPNRPGGNRQESKNRNAVQRHHANIVALEAQQRNIGT